MNLLGLEWAGKVFVSLGKVQPHMNIRRTVMTLLCGLMVGVGLPMTVQAALIDRGLFNADGVPGGPTVRLIYDDDRNITWLGDANLAASNTFGVGGINPDGSMAWSTANIWAGNLTVGGFTDWRLPKTSQPDLSCSIQNSGGNPGQGGGFGCTGSEMGHLFNVEGITAVAPGLFINVQGGPNQVYWSGTTNPGVNAAWAFEFGTGVQGADDKNNGWLAWAVRDGDVGQSPIPELAILIDGPP